MFACDECRQPVVLPRSLKRVTCRRCGETYTCNDGDPPRKLYPALSMYPITTTGEFAAVSKWMLTWTRPIRPGVYECRFRTTEPNVLRLFWDGVKFVTLYPDQQRVAMRDFLTWRGMLA